MTAQRAVMFVRQQPPKQQPPYCLVGMGIDTRTFRPVAKVRIASTEVYLFVDVGEAMQGISKSARRKAARYGKALPVEVAARIDKLIRRAVADYMAKRTSEVPKHPMPHKQVRCGRKRPKGETWPERGVLHGGLPDSSHRRH